MDEAIKLAFSKAKQDIFSLGEEISSLKLLIADMRNDLKILTKAFDDIRTEKIIETPRKNQEIIPIYNPTDNQKVPTIQEINPTDKEIPTDKLLSYVLKRQNMPVSTGNRGVPTNKQTNQQTNQHIIQHIKTEEKPSIGIYLPTTKQEIREERQEIGTTKPSSNLDRAAEILNSLDALKKEIRIKFKRLTSQEIAVFSMLYSLEDQGLEVDYKLISTKLNLSESSIRDYIGKLQKKGVPVIKEKLNNKHIILHISQDLKRIASLDTILKLREL